MHTKTIKKWIWLLIPLAGLVAGYLLMDRPVTITVDGSSETLKTHALTVKGALRNAGISLAEGDIVNPPAGALLTNVKKIDVSRSGSLYVWLDPQGELIPVQTTSRIPAEIVQAAGFALQPGDLLRVNGRVVEPGTPLGQSGRIVLQYTPAVPVASTTGAKKEDLQTSAGWLGKGLWQSGIQLHGANLLSSSFTQLLNSPLVLTITPAVPVEIDVDGQQLKTIVPVGTTGQALAIAGVALQDLDYSVPADGQPLPVDGKIKVVRVREEVKVEQSLIPFKTEYTTDPTLDLDQTRVISLGAPGVQEVRVRVRYEDGKEVSRTTEDAVVIKAPVSQQEAYGSTYTVKTLDTPDGTISYYRAVTVRVTSYSPCRSAGDRCYYGTSSGLPVQKGVIGVTRDWYHLFKGSQIYVPGYGIGTIADVGGGIPGSYWIDLGYSDADWVNWWGSVTIYFLTPVPANVPAVLP